MCPATVQDDTQITTHSYLVTGKPLPTVDFGPMLAAAGIDVSRPLAPPEFWRAIVESRPTEILTHFDLDKRRYRSTGLRDVLVRQEVFERVWGSTALEHYHEDDSSLLCAIHEMRKVGRTKIECPPGLAGLAGVSARSYPGPALAVPGRSVLAGPTRPTMTGRAKKPSTELDGYWVRALRSSGNYPKLLLSLRTHAARSPSSLRPYLAYGP